VALLADSILPFGADGHLDLGAVRAHALWLLGSGIGGLVVGAGEVLHADRKEKERALDVVADVAAGRPVIFPIWDPSPAYIVKLGRAAADRGVTAVLLPPPLVVPMSDDALVDWFRSVAEHVTAPVLAWHHPRFGTPLSPRVLARLQAESRIAGWYDASGDAHRVRRLAEAWPGVGWTTIDNGFAPEDLASLAALPTLAGGVSALANAWPDLVKRAWDGREPGLGDGLARRAATLERAGGIAALKRLLGVGARLPIARVDAAEFARLPPSTFR
jgi:4-hydroxy-tetrahydrodipicolinate synthase